MGWSWAASETGPSTLVLWGGGVRSSWQAGRVGACATAAAAARSGWVRPSERGWVADSAAGMAQVSVGAVLMRAGPTAERNAELLGDTSPQGRTWKGRKSLAAAAGICMQAVGGDGGWEIVM